MTNFCKDCDYQDHESNLVLQKNGGWRCKFCDAHPTVERYFACRCGEWKKEDVKQLYILGEEACLQCGTKIESHPINPAEQMPRFRMKFTVKQVGSDNATHKFLDKLCVNERVPDDTFRACYYVLNSLHGQTYQEDVLCAAFDWTDIKARMVLRDVERQGIINVIEY